MSHVFVAALWIQCFIITLFCLQTIPAVVQLGGSNSIEKACFFFFSEEDES